MTKRAPAGLRRPGVRRRRGRRPGAPGRDREGRQGESDVWFVGVDQDARASGQMGPSPCAADRLPGDVAKLSPKYIAIRYADDQAGYLAGMVAASASRRPASIGAIAGDPGLCDPASGPCRASPSVRSPSTRTSDSRMGLGRGHGDDVARCRWRPRAAFADQFIAQNAGIDVVFQAGVVRQRRHRRRLCRGHQRDRRDVDRALSDPASRDCILTSAEKRYLQVGGRHDRRHRPRDARPAGDRLFDASDGGIGLGTVLRRGESSPGRTCRLGSTPRLPTSRPAGSAPVLRRRLRQGRRPIE